MRWIYHPKAVHVRIAAGCNLGCVICERELLDLSPAGTRKPGKVKYADGRPDLDIEKDMTAAVWDLVAEKLMPHTENMELGGIGEPTIAKLFPRAAAEIVSAGKNLNFFTNGHYLHQKRVIDAVGANPHISVSMDAGTPEGYKRLRGGDLEKVVAGVRAFKAAVPAAKIDSQFTAIADNIEEIVPWVQLCAHLGIGRFARGEQLLVVGADHHVTNRVEQSVRFRRDRLERAIDQARAIAEEAGLWLMARLPPPSLLNPNAGEDGSDPKGFRRFSDLMLFGANPCWWEGTDGSGGGDTGTGATETVTAETIEEPPMAPMGRKMRGWLPDAEDAPADEPTQVVIAPKELYVDYKGECWSCLARNPIGHVATGNWASIVEENADYQTFLAAWHHGLAINDHLESCRKCPRRK